MGKRGPQSKFTDVACPNEACKEYGVAGLGNVYGNGTYKARNTIIRRYICHSCGKAFCDSSNTVYYNLRKDESTIDLALSISMKGMSNEATAEVLRIQPATIKRWIALAAKQCDKVNATLMKNLNIQRIEMDELWVIIKKSSSKNGSL
jgi:transposase-like protein